MAGRADELRDEVDILEYRAGDRGAFERLVVRWQPRLVAYVAGVIGDRDAAWDVCQELWLSVMDALDRGTQFERFPAWLYAVAHRKSVSHLRKRKRFERVDEACMSDAGEYVGDAHSRLIEAEDARLVRAGLEELPLALREAMLLFYMDDLSLEEIAGILRIPRGTVQSRLHYGRLRLKDLLAKKGYANGHG